MATLEQLAEGIRRAHAAGNVEHVRVLGEAYRQMQQGGAPSSAFADAMSDASAMSQSLRQPSQQAAPLNLGTATAATINGIVDGIPVLGPMARDITDRAQAGVGALMGGDYEQGLADIQARREQINAGAPIANVAGQLAGGIGSFAGLGALPGGASALGMTGNLGARIGNSALSGAVITAADEGVRGGDIGDMLTQGGIGGFIGGAIPGVGAAAKAALRPITAPVARTVRGAINPTREAAVAVGNALSRDRANVAAPVMSASDAAAAKFNGQPLLNVDRGGETTRALMRSAANQNPEARGVVDKMAEDRFRSQTVRTVQFFNRAMGGNVDDLARKAEINASKRATVTPAYQKATSSPAAQAIYTKPIQELLQSDAVQRAIGMVNKAASDEAAIAGFKRVANPFHLAADGKWKLRTDAAGRTVYPNLQFWDLVKRNLDTVIEAAGKHTTEGRRFIQLKQKLVSSLDEAVPEYRQARGTAALFFDAEDAVDAGRKAFAAPKAIDESLAAFNAMTRPEKDDFAIGMVSQLMDDVRSANNRQNLTRMFDIPARKELMEAALGPGRARQFEAFVRVEDIMDKVRGSLGNSTTARQLVEMGIARELGQTGGAGGLGGVAGFVGSGGNITTAMTVAALTAAGRAGFRAIQAKVDGNVLQKVAELLASGDEAQISKAVANAMLSKQHMLALEAIQRGIGTVARGTAMTALN